MNSKKRANDFSPVRMFVLVNRYRARLKYYEKTAQKRHKPERENKTWGYACQLAINKMRYRHKQPLIEQGKDELWDALIQMQWTRWKRSYSRIDAWTDREYKVLHKMNTGCFEHNLWNLHGSMWGYAVMKQVAKLNSTAYKNRKPKKESERRWNPPTYERKPVRTEGWDVLIKVWIHRMGKALL